MHLSFGLREGEALVAVERANGGELAPLLQVLWTLHGFTPARSRPSPAEFAASATLLIELGVVEYVDDQLGLTPEGRKLLRRSGMRNDPRHVALVDRAAAGVRRGRISNPRNRRPRRRRRMFARPSAMGTASKAPRAVPARRSSSEHYSPILGLGTPGLGMGSHRVPAVPPRTRARHRNRPIRPASGLAGTSSPGPPVRPRATGPQRARGRGRQLSGSTAESTGPAGRWPGMAARRLTRRAAPLAASRRLPA